jgi:YbgC/YbaW family acyl-CoA thioester hydrolase
MKKFKCTVPIHLSDTDASGVIFFPKIFEKCLIVLENYLKSKGMQKALMNEAVVFPVVSSHSQYFAAIKAYEELDAEMFVTRIGDTSITFLYKFMNQEGLLVSEVSIVHVCMDAKNRLKKSLPDEITHHFESLYHK